MAYGFLDLASTPGVRAAQEANGSGEYWANFHGDRAFDRFTEAEAAFIAERDSFYMATVSESGWPYVQHRGGPPGFIRILDEKTLAIPDFRGNRQYISTGNLATDDRAALILMDYPHRRRLKLYAHVEAKDLAADRSWPPKLTLPDYRAKVERALVIHLTAFDWNCPQHITPRFSEAELEPALAPFRARLEALEAENQALRAKLAERQPLGKPGKSDAERLKQKNGVQSEDDQRRERRGDIGQAAVDERAHNVFAAREYEERDDGRRQGDAEHHLAHTSA